MRDRLVIGSDTVAIRELIDEWRVGVPNDFVVAVVFHDNDENVVKRRHRRLNHSVTLAGSARVVLAVPCFQYLRVAPATYGLRFTAQYATV